MESSTSSTGANKSRQECNTGRFRLLFEMIKAKERAQEQSDGDPLSDEVSGYFGKSYRWPYEKDPIIFWTENQSQYPSLSALAQDILVIPATSAPVERLFSQASIAISGKRNRLGGDHLEREVMMKTNKRFF